MKNTLKKHFKERLKTDNTSIASIWFANDNFAVWNKKIHTVRCFKMRHSGGVEQINETPEFERITTDDQFIKLIEKWEKLTKTK